MNSAKSMKRKIDALSRRYQAALRSYLKKGPRASLQPAQRLGRRAMTLGLETLDLARIHAGALIALVLPGNSFFEPLGIDCGLSFQCHQSNIDSQQRLGDFVMQLVAHLRSLVLLRQQNLTGQMPYMLLHKT